MRTTPPQRTPALRPCLRGALVVGLLVAGLLTAGIVRGAVSAQPATAVRPGGSTTPQPPPGPTPTPTAPLPPACELEPLPAAARVTGTPTPMVANPPQWHTGVYAQTSGQYLLKRRGDLVSAVLATRAAPLPPPATLFTLPPAYRPPFLLWRDVAGRVVKADGSPDPAFPEPYPFRLWILPDGTVRQHWQAAPAVDERYLAYEMNVTWGTTPAANDHAVLALLDEHWFGTAVLSATPPKEEHRWQAPPHPYWDHARKERRKPDDWTPVAVMTARVTFNDRSRVAELYVSGPFFSDMPSELGQLGHLEHLTLRGRFESNSEESGTSPKYDLLTGNQIYYHTPGPGLTGPIPPELGLLTRLQSLGLSDNGLSGPIPPELGRLRRLQTLKLNNNYLSGAVPSELGQLTRLQHLDLADNWLVSLPPEIGQLDCLRKLDMVDNLLWTLPPELGQLSNLTHLFLGGNHLAVLPPELGQLSNLRWLGLYSNRLSTLPPELGQLLNLEYLTLMDNRLYELPPELGQLQKLRTLSAHRNQLTALPPELGQLQALTTLSLSDNSIATIPPELGPLAERGWDGWVEIDISHNPLTGCLPAAWLDLWPNFTLTARDAIGQRIEWQPPACPETEPTDRNQKDDVGKSDTGLG